MKTFYEQRPDPFFVGEMTDNPFPLHMHRVVELVVVMEGGCTIQLEDRTYTLRSGDAAVAFPLTPHSYESVEPDNKGFAAFFPAETFPDFSSVFFAMTPEEPVLRNAYGLEEIRYPIRHLMGPEAENELLRTAYLHLLLAQIVSRLSLRPARSFREKDLGSRILRYIYDHVGENITISSAAHELGISESHLSHLFAQQFHINFRRFINAVRIDKAAMMMHDPFMSLTQICDQCGFENMRTFRRAFVRETGSLPAAYMRALRSGTKQKASPAGTGAGG